MVVSHSEPTQADLFSLATLVARTGVPASSIHHYRRAGLLPAPRRIAANRFVYDERHVNALRAIRFLRERLGVPLDRISELLPGLLAEHGEAFRSEMWADVAGGQLPGVVSVSRRLVDAAIELFRRDGYAEVTVSQIAELAGVAKGSVYRHFDSKDALFTAAVRTIVTDLVTEFEAAMNEAPRPTSIRRNREKAATILGELIDPGLPVLLELGARAALGDQASLQLALWTLRTISEAVGRRLANQPKQPKQPTDIIAVGLSVIGMAFAGILRDAVEPSAPELDA